MTQAQQMVKHSSIYAAGNISRQLVGFIMLPVYTHYLTPADYGVIGLLIFLVSLFEIILGGHMFQAVPKFYHQEETKLLKNSVVTTALLVTSIFSGVACILMASFSDPLAEVIFGGQEYSIYIVIFSALILTHALEQYGLTYLRIVKKPWTYFNFNMVKLALQLGLNILTIVILDWGLMGLALSSLISSVLIASALSIYTVYKTGLLLRKNIALNILKFSWPLWISGVIGLYIGSSNRYFIRLFSSLGEVGLFELAAKFGSIAPLLIWLPFSQYWQTERFEIAKSSNPYPDYSLAFRMITALLVIAGIGVSIFSGAVINIMSAPPFHPAANAVPFLVVAGIFQSLTIFNNFSFMYTDRTLEVTKNNAVTAIAISIFYFLLIPWYGFIGASIAFSLGCVAQYSYALYNGNKLYPLKIRQMPLVVSILILLMSTLFDRILISPELSIKVFFEKSLIIFVASIAVAFYLSSSSERRKFRTLVSNALGKQNRRRH
ncbi:lipopolysaccharide biosynthesis protein [Marinobacter lipolyticus]|uniref:lipopolysaccharide biosynthesis protein n=1 Tax=Marinobacter lipolyticus TaxID=209639 RepID=UPI003A93F148